MGDQQLAPHARGETHLLELWVEVEEEGIKRPPN